MMITVNMMTGADWHRQWGKFTHLLARDDQVAFGGMPIDRRYNRICSFCCPCNASELLFNDQ